MKRLAAALVAALACAGQAQAGHGLMNAFSDVGALPAPGVTPAGLGWFVERWSERLQLYLAAVPATRVRMAERFARERLAEFVAVLQGEDGHAAQRAASAYQHDMDIALAAPADTGRRKAEDLAARLAYALLEHQYLLSLSYPDLPAAARQPAAGLMATMQAYYRQARTRLAAGVAESLFFKEEEVRWSWEMAVRADEVEP